MTTVQDVLEEIAPLLPTAGNLISLIAGAQASPILAVVQMAAQLIPVAAELVNRIENIRSATEAQYPQIWAPIKDDWIKTFAAWQALQAA